MKLTNDFVIEDLGAQEEWVYDLEVKDNHNFFGNDILIHNSNYFSLGKIKHLLFNNNDDIQVKVNKIDDFIKNTVDPVIFDLNNHYGEIMNAYEPEQIKAEREAIADAGIFIAKKRYILRVYDMEDVRYEEPYMKKMGVEIIKSSTPKFSKDNLNNCIDIILDGNNNDLLKWLNEVKVNFTSAKISDISKTTSVNKLNYQPGDKAIPINSRAAMAYNDFIKNNNLTDKHNFIYPGDKIKIVYLKEPNIFKSNIVAFLDSEFIENYREYIDFDLNWEKNFIAPLDIMVKSLNYKLEKVVDDNLDAW